MVEPNLMLDNVANYVLKQFESTTQTDILALEQFVGKQANFVKGLNIFVGYCHYDNIEIKDRSCQEILVLV